MLDLYHFTSLYQLIEYSSDRYGKKMYINPFEAELPPVHFEDVLEFVKRFDTFLSAKNISSQEKVAVILPNSSLHILILLSVMATGRVYVPINPKMGNAEMDYIIRDSKPSLIIHSLAEGKHWGDATIQHVYIPNEKKFFDEIVSTPSSYHIAPYSDEATAEIVYTSGSTGNPKGVEISQQNLLSNVVGIWDRIRPDPQDNFLTITPLFHNSGQFFSTFVPLLAGATCTVVRPELALVHFWELIEKFNIHWTLGMPTHINFLLHQNRENIPRSLKAIVVGGARLEDANHQQFQERFGVNILKTYGLTETCSFATCDYLDKNKRKIGSSGRPLITNEIKIFKNGHPLQTPNENGEIRIKGDNIFKGYLNNETLTASKFENGWFCTGDLGFMDEDNNIYIHDRIDNMVIVSGENVYPAEVENIVPLLTGITLGVLSSLPHSLTGRELVLVYEGAEATEAKQHEWRQILQKHIALYKIPKRFMHVSKLRLEKIPTASNGKILRKMLNTKLEELETHQTGLSIDG